MAIYSLVITAPYTPQGGTEKSAIQRICLAMLFVYRGLITFLNRTQNSLSGVKKAVKSALGSLGRIS
jgi:hypothetical protein